MYPEGATVVEPDRVETELDGAEWRTIAAARTGYIRSLDVDGLVHAARARDATIRLDRRVGEFVVEGAQIASVSGDAVALSHEVNACCYIDTQRTIEQDVAFGIRRTR